MSARRAMYGVDTIESSIFDPYLQNMCYTQPGFELGLNRVSGRQSTGLRRGFDLLTIADLTTFPRGALRLLHYSAVRLLSNGRT